MRFPRLGPPRRMPCFLALAAVTMSAPTPPTTCTCAMKTLCEKTRAADVIFEATPLSETTDGGRTTYTVSIGTIYKGSVAAGATVQSRASATLCGVHLQDHVPYIVFGSTASPLTVITNTCSGTTQVTNFSAADVQQIVDCATPAPGSGFYQPSPAQTRPSASRYGT